jgi:hypothetical protein
MGRRVRHAGGRVANHRELAEPGCALLQTIAHFVEAGIGTGQTHQRGPARAASGPSVPRCLYGPRTQGCQARQVPVMQRAPAARSLTGTSAGEQSPFRWRVGMHELLAIVRRLAALLVSRTEFI